MKFLLVTDEELERSQLRAQARATKALADGEEPAIRDYFKTQAETIADIRQRSKLREALLEKHIERTENLKEQS